jgi:hypothetical protein
VGSSFTEYRGTGPWSRGATIELWLYLLAQGVRQLDSPPARPRAAAEDWRLQAAVGMGGCASAALDKHASNPERVAVILQLAERAPAGLRGRGDVLPSAWPNSLGLGGPGATLVRDCPAEVFTRVGETLIRWLHGEVTRDAATSPAL